MLDPNAPLEPFQLPPHDEIFVSRQDLLDYANACFRALALEDGWKVVFSDKMRKSLGSCSLATRTIRLNAPFVDAIIARRAPRHIKELLLHEIAHALDKKLYLRFGHGPTFKKVARALGISPSSRHPFFYDPITYPTIPKRHWILCLADSGETLVDFPPNRPPSGYIRRSRNRLFILGRKEETLGKLVFKRVDYNPRHKVVGRKTTLCHSLAGTNKYVIVYYRG